MLFVRHWATTFYDAMTVDGHLLWKRWTNVDGWVSFACNYGIGRC